MPHGFSEDDAIEEILKLAVRKDAGTGILRDRLLATANELGISEEAVLAAHKQWEAEHHMKEELKAFGRAQRREFYSHLAIYLAVNTFLMIINLMGDRESFWFLYPLLGWGIGLVSHAFSAFSTHKDPYSKEFQRWKERSGTPGSPGAST